MKMSFLILCICFLSACTKTFLLDSINSINEDFNVFYSIKAGNQNYITILGSSQDDYTITYQIGSSFPSDCKSNDSITASGSGEVLIPSLIAGQRYSFRVCSSSNKTKALSFVAGNLNVAETYDLSSGLWNIWVKKNDDTQVCDTSVLNLDACFHASEVKKVISNNFETCDNLSLEDKYGFFNWSCSVESNKAVFYSSLKETTLLKDIITAGAFKSNSVSLKYKNNVINVSPLNAWWINDFIEISGTNTFIGSADNTIYYLAKDFNFLNTITLNGKNSALVTLQGAIISGTATTSNSVELGGTSQFSWLEINLQSQGTADAMRSGGNLQYIRHSTISGAADDCIFVPGGGNSKVLVTDSTIRNCNYGIYINASNNNLVRNTLFQSHAVSGFELNNTDGNVFTNNKFLKSGEAFRFVGSASNFNYISNSTIADSTVGINLGIGGENVFNNLKIYNSSQRGVNVSSSIGAGNRFINLYIIGSGQQGIKVNSATAGLKFINVVTAFNKDSGVELRSSSQIDFVNITSLRNASNSGTGGFLFSDTDKISCTNCLSSLNNNYGFIIGESSVDSTNNHFHGNLIVANNASTQCEVVTAPNTSHGIVDTTCTTSGSFGSTDFTDVNSTATYYNSIDLSNSFEATVSSDLANTHGSSLPISFDSITDWFNFENSKRFWVNEGARLVVDANNKDCSSGSNCELWDMSLKNSSENALFNSSFNFAAKNPPAVGSNCPLAVRGSEYVDSQTTESNFSGTLNAIEINTDAMGNDDGICEVGENCYSRYLKHAYEIVDDEIGDDDGLCESNEACIYSPNWAEAETPKKLSQCTFTSDGGIAGVQMWVPTE